jgi:hypothetical protein
MDLNFFKQEQARLEQKASQGLKFQSSGKDRFWSPKVSGTYRFRILPNPNDKSNPFFRMLRYWAVFDKNTYFSPLTFGKPDPVEQAVIEIKNEAARKNDKELMRVSDKITPKENYACYVIIRGAEKEGVKIWTFSPKVYRDLVALSQLDGVGDYTDLNGGRDIILTYKRDSGADTNKVVADYSTCPASTDPDVIRLITKTDYPDFSKLYYTPSEEELKGMLKLYLGADEDLKHPQQKIDSEQSAEAKINDYFSSDLPF